MTGVLSTGTFLITAITATKARGAIRLGKYKLLEYYENGSVQLFDLEKDIGEQNDLSKAKPMSKRSY